MKEPFNTMAETTEKISDVFEIIAKTAIKIARALMNIYAKQKLKDKDPNVRKSAQIFLRTKNRRIKRKHWKIISSI